MDEQLLFYMKKTFKVILAGDGRVGKTTFRKQYLGDNFKKDYMATLGADFAVQKTELDGIDITLQIWDLAGQPKFSAIRDKYYAAADGVLLMFDISQRSSYDNIPNWLDEFMDNTNDTLRPMLLIGNKSDLIEKGLDVIEDDEVQDYITKLRDWGTQYMEEFGISYLKTSAKMDINVDEAFKDLMRQMIAESEKKN